MRLVDAGFFRGIDNKTHRRLYLAEFDLSAAKLEELRKRRVTDPIIAAMVPQWAARKPREAETQHRTRRNRCDAVAPQHNLSARSAAVQRSHFLLNPAKL